MNTKKNFQVDLGLKIFFYPDNESCLLRGKIWRLKMQGKNIEMEISGNEVEEI